jgi:hypothetical protein
MYLMEISKTNQLLKNVLSRKWRKEEEQILKEWADKAVCYKWLHLKSYEYFRWVNALYTIPVIILSTLTGTANFAQDRVSPSFLNTYVMLVGGFNIIAGIISTIHQYLKIAQYTESHRVAYISWEKFARKIRIELAKNPKERIGVNELIKTCGDEYDRLEEISPPINNYIINLFKTTFGEIHDLIKPDILGKINPTIIYNKENHIDEDNDEDEIQKIVNANLLLQSEKISLQKELEHLKTIFFKFDGSLPKLNEINNVQNELKV